MDEKISGQFREILEQQRKVLLKEAKVTVEGMSGEETDTFPDPTDRASAETDRSLLLRMRDRERRLITKIDEALERIKNGEFGICESCGGHISTQRLKARPVTTFCIDCKTEAEQKEKPEL